MALRKITTIPLFKSTQVGVQGSGGTSQSDPIDLRDICAEGVCSLSYSIASTNGTVGAGTAGSSLFSYFGCPVFDGTYVALGTFGTQGVGAAQSGAIAFTPIVIPFIKIQAIAGTSNPIVLTAELNVR